MSRVEGKLWGGNMGASLKYINNMIYRGMNVGDEKYGGR